MFRMGRIKAKKEGPDYNPLLCLQSYLGFIPQAGL